jgi:hypothetical protein
VETHTRGAGDPGARLNIGVGRLLSLQWKQPVRYSRWQYARVILPIVAMAFFAARWGCGQRLPAGPTDHDSAATVRLSRNPGAAGGRAVSVFSLLSRGAPASVSTDKVLSDPGSAAVWQPVGPAQIATSGWNVVTGPVTSIAADLSDITGNTVYLGTAGGGVWKSTNAAGPVSAVSFVPLTDSLSFYSSASLASLSIGAVSVQPGGTGVVLAGTGNPRNYADSWYGAGLLRSTDGGNTWSLISNAGNSLSGGGLIYTFAGNAFAGFAWSTTQPNFVVAAVANSGYGTLLGIAPSLAVLGLYYSSDAGQTWQLATLEDGTQVIESDLLTQRGGNAATAVVWNPVRQRFYAAIRYHGYYESVDGVTWTRLASQPGANLTTSLCPANPALPGSPACPLFRGALAVQPVTGDMFALTVDAYNHDQGLWRDICNLTAGACASGTVRFAAPIPDGSLQSSSGSGVIPEAAGDLWLAAVPALQDTLLFAGATDIWRCSLANSCAWRNTTNAETCGAAQVAPRQQAVEPAFGASGLVYFGNEGGLWRSTDAVAQQASPCSGDDASHFQNLNSGLGSLAQVTSFSQDSGNSSTWLAALGDLGTAAPGTSGSVWNQVLDGEGVGTAIDPANPDNWYATSLAPSLGIDRCTAGVNCNPAGFTQVAIGESQIAGDQQTIPAPWILDPVDSENLLLGTCRIWRGPATGSGWSSANLLSPMLDGIQGSFCDGNAEIRSLAAAPNLSGSGTSAEYIYAGMAGGADGGGLLPGHLFVAAVTSTSSQANTSWSDRYSSPVINGLTRGRAFNPGGVDVSSIVADGHDPTGQTIYVTLRGVSSLAASQPLLYQSTDAGAHWLDITANLPSSPANSVAVDPNDANIVYVALDTGVYYANDVSSCSVSGAQCWNLYGSGLPNTAVTSLMTFNPATAQQLRAGTWGRGIWQAPLLSAGEVFTTAVLAPDLLTFPAQQVQTLSASQNLTLTNSGTAPLNVSRVVVTGDFLETDNCSGAALASGTSCQLQIVFAPTLSGTRSGLLTVFANVEGGQLTASFQGTAVAAAAAIQLTPSSLSFGGIRVGSSSNPQYITIANTGGQPATLNAETVTGDFTLSTNTCGANLPVNASCTVGIVFTPTTSGTRQGLLTVTDSAGAQTASLMGDGQSAATDALAPLSLSFAAQQVGTTSTAQTVALTNAGDLPLTNIAISISGDFTVANNCGSVLQGHGSCVFAVAYAPAALGVESGTFTVIDGLRTQTVSLTGTGLAPPGASALPSIIDFGGFAPGTTSSPATVTVTNSGSFVLASLAASITAGFTIASNNCPATLGIGSACQIGVAFSPAAAGPLTGSLTVTAANLSAPLTVRLNGAGADFALAVSGSSSAVLNSGQTATFALQLAGLAGTTGAVALTCSGAPHDAQCSLNPSSVTLNGLNSASVTATLATGVTTNSAFQRSPWKAVLPALALSLPLCCLGFSRGRRTWVIVLIAIVALTLSAAGCAVSSSSGTGGGGSGGSQNQTPAGTYPLTITAKMSNVTHTVQVNVTVQ